MEGDTIARIYSLTKIVSGVAALTLIEEGKLGLSHPIKDYLPEFSDMKIFVGGTAQHRELIPAEVAITVHHLFTHSSGYSYGDDEEPIDELYRSAGLEKAESLADLVKMLAALPLKREPGTMYEYGFSTDILARLVEVVSGQRFDHFLQQRILGPLGRTDTLFCVDAAKLNPLAKGYEHVTKGGLQPVKNFVIQMCA